MTSFFQIMRYNFIRTKIIFCFNIYKSGWI